MEESLLRFFSYVVAVFLSALCVYDCVVHCSAQIVPIEGLLPVNDEQQKTFEEILPEIMISK